MDFEIRRDRTAQGPMKLSRERTAYSRLMQQGYTNTEACCIVGITRRTGQKWRHGRGAEQRQKAAPPIRTVVPPSGDSRYLSEDERIYIADRLRDKATVRAIAAELGRSPSTISREIRRNRTDSTRGQWHYRPYAAQARADARWPRPKPRRITGNPELRDAVQAMLDERWSPEQICHALRRQFPDRPEMRVVHETVYQALYIQGRGELRRELAGALRSGRARSKPQRQANCRRSRFTDPMVMISEGPAEAEDRAVPGHWEGDLILGKEQKSAIGTLVERSTRFVMLLHLPGDHTAETVRDALVATARTLPTQLKRNQGSEMVKHAEFSLATDIPVYFCDPASPWQRGSNENTNGLLRQYLPKGTDLSVHTPEHLAAAADQFNPRPRKRLGWETPAERLAKFLAA
ncbi:IS30 family transposase [Kitasatospora sp. NPDC096077]|uniref:IS30 family transposase n=1 Tax=Kitasatospora sp. NPDC096077 TaxID=3155544 RepID=UPI00331DD098